MQYKIFAFGGSGSKIISALILASFDRDVLFFFDTDRQTFIQNTLSNKFLLGQGMLHGRGTAGRTSLANEAFKQDIELIKKLISDDCLYIVVGGLGGGTCSGMVADLAELFNKHQRKSIFIVTFPFDFEGESRHAIAYDSIRQINHYNDKVVLVNSEETKELIGSKELIDMFRDNDISIVQLTKELIFEFSHIVPQGRQLFDDRIEEVLERLKRFIKDSFYLVTAQDSKIIVPNTNRRILEALMINPDSRFAISPRKFEELVEYIHQLSGWKTKLTPLSKDHGVDMLVWTPPPVLGDDFLTIIQTKQYNNSNKVGEPEIHQLKGSQMAFRAEKAQMITTSDFTGPAIKAAKEHRIDLIRFYDLTNTIKQLIFE
jgi:hypothetical protein